MGTVRGPLPAATAAAAPSQTYYSDKLHYSGDNLYDDEGEPKNCCTIS